MDFEVIGIYFRLFWMFKTSMNKHGELKNKIDAARATHDCRMASRFLTLMENEVSLG